MPNSAEFSFAHASVPDITVLSAGAKNSFTGAWPNRVLAEVSRAELHTLRAVDPWARALVYAGGGYTSLVYDKEGLEVAHWLNSHGIDAHVLVHRLPGAKAGDGAVFPKDIALTDGLAALDVLKAEAGDLPLFHFGLSSGGHMAGVMSCQDHAPASCGAVIAYAPVNANHRQHKFPPEKPDYPPVEKQDFYDDWPIGLSGHAHGLPKVPVFLAYALHDQSVPVQHALRLIETASMHELDVDAHIFGAAPHGFALRELDGTQSAWPELVVDWMKRKAGV